MPNSSNSDAFIAKFDVSGKEIWASQFSSLVGTTTAHKVVLDQSGNVYVAGDTTGALPGQTSTDGRDAYVQKYDLSGKELWTVQFGTAGGELIQWMAFDARSGYVYVAGKTSALPGQAYLGERRDLFIAKFDDSGNSLGFRLLGLENGEEVSGFGCWRRRKYFC